MIFGAAGCSVASAAQSPTFHPSVINMDAFAAWPAMTLKRNRITVNMEIILHMAFYSSAFHRRKVNKE
jgi:hypothetical protein